MDVPKEIIRELVGACEELLADAQSLAEVVKDPSGFDPSYRRLTPAVEDRAIRAVEDYKNAEALS
jgi:hypothetical protein